MTMTQRKYYLAGPMKGYENFNFSAFDQAAYLLREEGHYVFSPAEADRKRLGSSFGENAVDGTLQEAEDEGFDLRVALAEDTHFICTEADAIALLPGWEFSQGAQAEWALARALGLEIRYL